MTDPYGRTPEGFLERVWQRLDGLDSRLTRLLPPRLSPQGDLVTDCDDAVANGWYRAPDAANSPVSTVLGQLFVYTTITGSGAVAIRQEFRRIFIDGGAQDRRVWLRTSVDNGATWTAWYEESTGPFQTRIAGSVSVPGNTIVTAYSYTVPAANRDRVAIMSGAWLVQQTLASGYLDFRLRRDSTALTFYRYSSGLAPSHSVTLTASTVIPAGTSPVLDFAVASNSPTAVSASADSSFYNLSIVLI